MRSPDGMTIDICGKIMIRIQDDELWDVEYFNFGVVRYCAAAIVQGRNGDRPYSEIILRHQMHRSTPSI